MTNTLSVLGKRMREPVIVDLLRKAEDPKLLSLAAGLTANSMLPTEIVENAMRSMNKNPQYAPSYLQYSPTRGREHLCKLLAEHLNALEPAAPFDASEFLITTGSQQSLYMAMQVLCDPGDIVFVEAATYFVFLELLQGLGIQAVPMPAHANGAINLEAFEKTLQEYAANGQSERMKAVYLVSYYSNPTARTIDLETKTQLGTLLSRVNSNLLVMEDAAYREVYFDAPSSIPSIFGLKSYDGLKKLYLGTFSKSFSSGLKLGYSVSNCESLRNSMLYVKGHHDFGSSHTTQAIIEYVLESGDYQKQIDHQKTHYKASAECLHEALLSEGMDALGWNWELPEGGLFFWISIPEEQSTALEDPFFNICLEMGVFYVPGDLCIAGESPPLNYMRVSFGTLTQADLREAAHRLKTAYQELLKQCA